MDGKAIRAALGLWDGCIDCPRESSRIILCKTGDKLNEKAHAAHPLTAGLCKGSSKKMLLQDDLFPQEKNSSFLFSLYWEPPKSTTSFCKVVVFQKCYWLTCWLSTLLEIGLNLGGEKHKNNLRVLCTYTRMIEENQMAKQTTSGSSRLSHPSSFRANQFPPNDKNTCYFCLPD